MRKKIIATIGVACLTVLLASCSGNTPAPSQSPTPEVSESAPSMAEGNQDLAKIVLNGEEFELLNFSGETISSFRYDESPVEAIDSLTENFGAEPKISDHESDGCYVDAKGYSWGSLMVGFAGEKPEEAKKFTLTASSDKTPVPVETKGGVMIGDTYDAAEAKVSGALNQVYQDSETNTEYHWLVADQSSDQEGIPADAGDARGAIALALDGTVTSIYSGTMFTYC